jgi:CysZ protein
MQFIQNFRLTLFSFYKAIRLIIAHQLGWYILIPAILMLFVYQLGATIQQHQPEIALKTMNDISWYFIQLLFEITIGFFFMRSAKYLVVILLSPMIAQLSQKTAFILTGEVTVFTMRQLIHDVERGIRIVLRNLMWEYLIFALIYIFARIGWSNVHESPLIYLIFIVGFFYYGFSFLDYTNERLKRNMEESILFARKNRGLAIGIGMIYSLMIWVPVDLKSLFNWSTFQTNPFEFIRLFVTNLFFWFIAACAPVVTVVTATIAMYESEELSKKNNNPVDEQLNGDKKNSGNMVN